MMGKYSANFKPPELVWWTALNNFCSTELFYWTDMSNSWIEFKQMYGGPVTKFTFLLHSQVNTLTVLRNTK